MGIIEKIEAIDATKSQQKLLHATIKKVTEDIESFSFNTAISQMMIFVNAFTNAETIPLSAMRTFLILLNPFAPHISSELWESLSAEFGDARGDSPNDHGQLMTSVCLLKTKLKSSFK